jgi:cytochrome c-type biogenesis protein CcmH/NrfG
VDDAIAALERAVAIQAQDWRGYYYLGVAYDHKGDGQRAKDAYKKAERLHR